MYEIKKEPKDFVVTEIIEPELDEKGNYSYFWLTKENETTMRALEVVAKKAKVPLKWMGFAGTKDKIAVTKQMISVKGRREKLGGLELDRISLDFVGYGNEPISLGKNMGNHFEIVVCGVERVPKKIGKFVNYFGEQRFSVNNVDIGRAIVKRDFKRAVELFIEGNAKEKESIILHLEKHNNDYIGALRKIPKRLLRLVTNAFQSHIWNETVKKVVDLGLSVEEVPIVGFGTRLGFSEKEGKVKEIVDGLLKDEGIGLRDFIIREFPELSMEGDERKVWVSVEDLVIEEMNEERVKLEFSLGKGCYATVFIKQLIGGK